MIDGPEAGGCNRLPTFIINRWTVDVMTSAVFSKKKGVL